MLRHLMKLIWKRKSRNLMLSLEILLAFVVLFAVAAFAIRNYQLYHLPTGFHYQDRWSVEVKMPDQGSVRPDQAQYDQFKRGLLALPEVETVAFSTFGQYEMSTLETEFMQPDGSHKVRTAMLNVSDDFFAANAMQLAEGRWFSSLDDGADATPVVINRRLARRLFPGRSPLGLRFVDGMSARDQSRPYRVSGVVEDFRPQGEYMTPAAFALVRLTPASEGRGFQSILLRLRPGTPRSFESALSTRLRQVRNDCAYTITPLADARTTMLHLQTLPLKVLAVIAAFLLVMVAFGLFGVLWQNTTLRIPEIGLRRALGADAGHIYRQIIGEQLLLSTGAIAVGALLLVQLPITGALGETLNWTVFAAALALSAAMIYLLSLLCSLYPGWRAARLSPTEALHYE